MNFKFLSIKLVIILSVFIALLYSCANIGSITGGPRDSLAPVMIASKPKMEAVNFKGKKVILRFNEYFELKDINQEFVASPPFKEMPKFTVKQKSLHIKFQEELQENVTYNLKFGKAIADFNEGNINKDLQYIFATKDTIDLFAISGNLRDAYTLEVPENTFVALYHNNIDSIPYLEMPNYIANLDSAGYFNIDYIAKGDYKIFAFKDLNNNKIADSFEPHAFLDSLIETHLETVTIVDSLKAGTILHDKINHALIDSLIKDTVIVQDVNITTPNNLQMYLFEETKIIQKLNDFTRKKPSTVKIFFDIPIDENFKIEPLNFNMPFEDMIIESSLNNDTLTWWIQDSAVIKQDSLEAIVSYSTIDTLGNYIVKNDTLLFEYRKKKERNYRRKKNAKKQKAKPKQYIEPKFLTRDSKVELRSNLNFELPTPLTVVDTSKIKLFEVYDTMVVDTRKQEMLKQLRLSKNELYFKFRRPIAKEFSLKLLNFEAENWYSESISDSNRVYQIKITNPEVAAIDTLQMLSKYDNNFFFNQIQEIKDTLRMPLSDLRITSRKRNKPKEVTLAFDRPVKGNILVNLDDYDIKTSWYKIKKNAEQDSVKIIITDDKISYNDTITFGIKCFNFIDIKGDSAFFEQTMRIIYKDPKQFIKSHKRTTKDSVQIVFNTKLQSEPSVQLLNTKDIKNWYKLSKTADTLTYQITNPAIVDKDSLKLIFAYNHKNHKGVVAEKQDTLVFVTEKKQRKRRSRRQKEEEENANKEKVSINLPVSYDMYPDSLKMRLYHIKYEWKEDTKYVLSMDSMAFVDIYSIYNKSMDYDFATRKNSYYTALVLNLQDIHANKRIAGQSAANDSTVASNKDNKESQNNIFTKSMQEAVIGSGHVIVHLINKDKNVVREFFIDKDSEIVMDFLHPGEYSLRIIYDRNNNGFWDTGDYFKNIQAERIITNGKAFMLKTNFENKFTWDVGKTLVESCFAKKREVEE